MATPLFDYTLGRTEAIATESLATVGLLQVLTSSVYGDTSVPHMPFEHFLEPSRISFGVDKEDKQVSKLALAIA